MSETEVENRGRREAAEKRGWRVALAISDDALVSLDSSRKLRGSPGNYGEPIDFATMFLYSPATSVHRPRNDLTLRADVSPSFSAR